MSLQSSDRIAMGWIESLIDEHSFLPFYPTHQDSNNTYQFGPEIITGLAKVNQRAIAVYAHNTNSKRGYISRQGAIKIARLMDRAYELKIPIIAFLASPGIAMEEGLASGNEYTQIISKNIALSGVVPQLAVILAPTLGAPAYSSVLMDITFFNKNRSFLMVTSPTVVQHAINEKVTMGELGGAAMHASVTGIADFVDDTMTAQINQVKAIIDFFPLNTYERPPLKPVREPLQPMPIIPDNPQLPFNMLELMAAIVDNSDYLQYKRSFGQAMICAFAYIHGYPVGIVANQSTRFSGAIDADASQKAARFIRLCDAYNIPILTLIDVPGFMPGKREEQKGLLRHGARLCAAMQTMVPRISVVVRKCYGAAAFLMMQTKSQHGDLVLALESSHIGIMSDAASSKVSKIDQAALDNKENRTACENSLNSAYSMGLIDEIITPVAMRNRLSQHLEYLFHKQERPRLQKKHFIDP
ncbi:acyl-CoA carboxylase subunit beta [Legionella nagasakiensis]|uniref:acyl-CoA carboxylase subunit beta n=1 Tax=Legionella nagasakiensis TaxID=535290 RepID=UPI001055C31C|nr:carboxyl transferase domain-containing protein [Legionella nagasakiensis]